MGVFDSIFAGLAAQGGEPDEVMIDVTHLKAHRTAVSLLKGHFPDASIARQTVRHQGFWNRWQLKLSESLAHLLIDIMRPACGIANVAR